MANLLPRVDGIAKTVDDMYAKFDHTLFGNGQKGLYEITKANSINVDSLSKQIESVASQIRGVSDELSILSALVTKVTLGLQEHINDPKQTFKQLVLDNIKTIIFWFVVLFVVLHAVLPADITLWTLIEKLF